MTSIQMRDVRGFNYEGSWGTTSVDLFQHHDSDAMGTEVGRGKEYFPGWNVARWWLSPDAFQRDRERFLADIESGFAIFAGHDVKVVPVLFNRWHDPVCGLGGVPIDHIVPEFSEYCPPGAWASLDSPEAGPAETAPLVFRDYIEALVGAHANDERVFAWDLCNEPLMGPYIDETDNPLSLHVRETELEWLRWCGEVCRASGATQPVTIGCSSVPGDTTALQITEPIVDFISFHPYRLPGVSAADFEGFLDEVAEFAAAAGKGLLASEAAWGSTDDAERVATCRYQFEQLSKRDIGFLAHALHHSLVADLHRPEHGPVGSPGCLQFIEADGSLRPGHEVFNEF